MVRHSFLVLADGTVYPGRGFGAVAPIPEELVVGSEDLKAAGEVVFNTAMSGYYEVLTDPSYTGQLVALTYPHAGNYGCLAEWSEVGPEGKRSARQVKPAGLIVRRLYTGPIPDGRITLDQFLRENDTPGIAGVDTRSLTLHLREHGSMNGVVVENDRSGEDRLSAERLDSVVSYLRAFPEMVGRNLIGTVGTDSELVINESGRPNIVLLDCGLKANIIRELVKAGCKVTLVPSTTTAEQLTEIGGDALFVGNGPGDPAVLQSQVELIKATVGTKPLLGICLGHQLISEAIGGETYKMKFGHHGVNHPVRDEETKRVFVTSQNHGFAVKESSLPEGCSVWFRNANDQSVEGIKSDRLRVRTAQFHPESAPGPYDSHWIFKAFLEAVER